VPQGGVRVSYLLATGSVQGREHARLFRNNQDGVCARIDGSLAVAVVTDGCGSGADSEVGARLGARFLAQHVPSLARTTPVGPELADKALEALVGWMRTVVAGLDEGAIADQWLFTVLCAVMDGKTSLIFGVGDGVWRADGVGRVLEAGEKNAPDYPGYRLVPALGEKTGVPVVHFCGEAKSVSIATDGLAHASGILDGLHDDGLIWRNPMSLQRRLRVLADRDRLLHDDTTVALLKRGA